LHPLVNLTRGGQARLGRLHEQTGTQKQTGREGGGQNNGGEQTGHGVSPWFSAFPLRPSGRRGEGGGLSTAEGRRPPHDPRGASAKSNRAGADERSDKRRDRPQAWRGGCKRSSAVFAPAVHLGGSLLLEISHFIFQSSGALISNGGELWGQIWFCPGSFGL